MTVLVALLFVGLVSAQQPDRSAECIECKETVQVLENFFYNETDVQKLLQALDQFCMTNYTDPQQQQICEDVMQVLVEIPPALFNGLQSLAWDIPLGLCATIFKCHVECCSTNYGPEQIHLSLTNDLTEMAVTWVTLNVTQTSTVQYGLSPSSLTMQSVGTNRTYIAGGWLGTIHSAIMTGLKPSTTYYYRVGDSTEKNAWSSVFNFTTFSSDPNAPITYAIFGDMAYDNNSDYTVSNVAQAIAAGTVQIVIHVGDISYADGYMMHWDNFFNKIQPIASRVPYMVVPGNHELWYNFTAYKHRFSMPGMTTPGGSGDNMYYSWELGNIHFLACDSETAVDTADIGPEQQKWIIDDLEKVNRTRTPWLFAYFHRPLYCSNHDTENCVNFAELLRHQVEDTFNKYGVDVVMNGHVHDYERTYPMYQGNATQFSYTDATAPVYIVQGASGNREGNENNFPSTEPSWSAAHYSDIGFAILNVNMGTLTWSFYASGPSGPTLRDSFVMKKSLTL